MRTALRDTGRDKRTSVRVIIHLYHKDQYRVKSCTPVSEPFFTTKRMSYVSHKRGFLSRDGNVVATCK